MSELIVSSRPELRRPVLIAAFRGWNDGGQGATLGAGYLARQWGAEAFAEIDPENFYDFQAVRPNVSLEKGLTRKLEWPSNTFLHAPIPDLDRDAVVMMGVEPNLRWKTYSQLVLDLAQELGVEMVVTLGSLLADVPHTRPAPVSAAASDPALVEELGVEPSRYEGPTGILGVLLDSCRRAGIPSVSLCAAVGLHCVQVERRVTVLTGSDDKSRPVGRPGKRRDLRERQAHLARADDEGRPVAAEEVGETAVGRPGRGCA